MADRRLLAIDRCSGEDEQSRRPSPIRNALQSTTSRMLLLPHFGQLTSPMCDSVDSKVRWHSRQLYVCSVLSSIPTARLTCSRTLIVLPGETISLHTDKRRKLLHRSQQFRLRSIGVLSREQNVFAYSVN